MVQKAQSGKPPNTGPLSTPQDGKWIKYQFELRDIELNDIAKQLGVTRSAISRVTLGQIRSYRIEQAIADALDFDSFEDVLIAARNLGGRV